MKKNFKLIEMMHLRRLTQAEVVRLAGLPSEAFLSRVINGYRVLNSQQAQSLSRVLAATPGELGIRGDYD